MIDIDFLMSKYDSTYQIGYPILTVRTEFLASFSIFDRRCEI